MSFLTDSQQTFYRMIIALFFKSFYGIDFYIGYSLMKVSITHGCTKRPLLAILFPTFV